MSQVKDLVDAIDAFVKGTKADGTWNALRASCIMAGWNNLNGALTPLVGAAPTNFNFVGADYNRKTGLKGNGTTKYLNSNRNNNADPQNDQHVAVRLTESDTGTRLLIGVGSTTTNRTAISIFGGYVFRSRNNTTVEVPITSENAIGLLGISRNNSANHVYHVGGTSLTVTRDSLVPGNQNIGVFAGGDAQFPSSIRANFYSIGENLNLTQLDTRTAALMTAIDGAIP
jgi:hypothetical protein